MFIYFLRSALKHFCHFLTRHTSNLQFVKDLQTQRKAENKDTAIVEDDVTLSILQAVGMDIMGEYIGYLANIARMYRKDDRAKLSLNCADSYLSAIKSYYARQLFTNTPILVFTDNKWTEVRKRFKSAIMIRLLKEGRSLVKSKPASTSKDSQIMAHLALWKGANRNRIGVAHSSIIYRVGWECRSIHELFDYLYSKDTSIKLT